jgi:hypothetical protein
MDLKPLNSNLDIFTPTLYQSIPTRGKRPSAGNAERAKTLCILSHKSANREDRGRGEHVILGNILNGLCHGVVYILLKIYMGIDHHAPHLARFNPARTTPSRLPRAATTRSFFWNGPGSPCRRGASTSLPIIVIAAIVFLR